MASSVYRTIFVGNAGVKPVIVEAPADEADIKPGMLVRMEAAEEFEKHATADGDLAGPFIALVNQTPSDADASVLSIDQLYDIDDIMYAALGRPGEVYNMLIAASQTLVKGVSRLGSNGDGTLKLITQSETTIALATIGIAWADLASVGSVQRCLVMIT